MSGIDAVRKIVETEAQARKIVEEAKARSQELLSRASREAEKVREEILARAQKEREQILSKARSEAEAEAAASDALTAEQLENYRKAFESRKQLALEKALNLVLQG